MQRARSLTPPPGRIEHGLDLHARNGLRYLAGCGRARPEEVIGDDGTAQIVTLPASLFPPAAETTARLLELGLVEPHPDHPGEHRPTERGVELLPKIGAKG